MQSRPSPACISAHTDIPPDFCPHSNFKPSASLALAPFSFKFSLPFSVSLQLHRTRFQLWLQSGFATLVIRSSSLSPLLQLFTCYFWHLHSLTLIYGTTRWTPESSVHTRFMINFWFNDKGWSRNGVLPPKTSPCTYKFFFFTRLWRPRFLIVCGSFPPNDPPWPAYTVCKLYIFSILPPRVYKFDTSQGIIFPRHSTAHMR